MCFRADIAYKGKPRSMVVYKVVKMIPAEKEGGRRRWYSPQFGRLEYKPKVEVRIDPLDRIIDDDKETYAGIYVFDTYENARRYMCGYLYSYEETAIIELSVKPKDFLFRVRKDRSTIYRGARTYQAAIPLRLAKPKKKKKA
jgi:hypothetical protein